MSIFISVFLISIKSYSFFFLLLFTKENMMKMDKNEKFALCAVYNSSYLPGSTKALQYSPLAIYILFFPLISPQAHPNQNSGKKGFILCKQNCVAFRGNLTLATTLRGHVGTSVEGHEHLFADETLRED